MGHWIDDLSALAVTGEHAVLVTVVSAKGSVPRGAGTRMVVARNAIHGTIGGGHLEFKATEIARELLATRGEASLQRFPLGASLGQCCGGIAQLLFEPVVPPAAWVGALSQLYAEGTACAVVTPVRGDASEGRMLVTASTCIGTLGAADRDAKAATFARDLLREGAKPVLVRLDEGDNGECFFDVVRPPDLDVVLFGAGHVGRAVVRALEGVPCRVTWVDTRDDVFPGEKPAHVRCVATDVPETEVATASPGACFLVMTHSHALDEALAERILARDDFAYFGLIGSIAKRRQFERRLEARGTPRARFAAMTCPIGVAGITGKEPAVIAVAVVAQLLQARGQHTAARAGNAACRA